MENNLKIDIPLSRERSKLAIVKSKQTSQDHKFKKTVHVLIDNLRWMNSLMNNAEEHLKELVVTPDTTECSDVDISSKVPNFNLNKFKADIRCGRITETAKGILRKEPCKRTEEETRQLCNLVGRIKFFEKYSPSVRYELSKVMEFQTFNKDKVILKQGDQAYSFYFIVSGCVLVEVTEEDQSDHNLETRIMTELREGSSFGELALIHECKRRATIVSKEKSEFLVIHKEDYEVVMKNTAERDWTVRHDFFKQFRYTNSWSETKINLITESSSIQEFSPNSVIFKDFTKKEYVYFIVAGQCKVVQIIDLYEKKLTKGFKEYYLKSSHSNPDLSGSCGTDGSDQGVYHGNGQVEATNYGNTCEFNVVSKRRQSKIPTYRPKLKVQKHTWVVGNLKCGDFFGVGEKVSNAQVIAEGKVICIVVPTFTIIHHDDGKTLEDMRFDINERYPSSRDAIKSYNANKRWDTYKKQLVQEVLQRKGNV